MARNAQQHLTTSTICRLLRRTEQEKILVALPGLEPGLSALRGRRVNQLHHNARSHPQEDVFSSASTKYSKPSDRTQTTDRDSGPRRCLACRRLLPSTRNPKIVIST